MRASALLVALVLAAVPACGGGNGGDGGDAETTAAATGPVFERGTAVIESQRGEVEGDV